MDRLEEAKHIAEEQYKGAVELDLQKFACRAIGTAGVLSYQLYLENNDKSLLNIAIDQLNERVERAQRIQDVVLEAVGTGRLSLCYMAKGDHDQSVRWAKRNYDLMKLQYDATKIGFSRAFLGRALIAAERQDEAVAVINEAGGCSPVISLCNEISGEHRQYIVDLINAGADLKLRDERGYSALECTVYNGDTATTAIIEKGLQAQILREGGNVIEEIAQLKWIGKGSAKDIPDPSPDDSVHTQYRRMLRAIEQFLDLRKEVDRHQLGIWIDFACVDQDNQKSGVAALPMNLAQCNAMISLTDDDYYNRSCI
ncbi:hypothetical protein G6514_008271 [Epicoccum nigrum]|nr:hypothetical protein G6514_008271 [Epicoccum nigrum]